jgi:protoporphyrinogen oxidase
MNMHKTVIVGSGLSALLMARMIRLYRNPDADIVIIERDENIGGQFGSINYGEHGYFDIGMHIFYESCIPEIDRLFTDLLPEEEWNILEGNYKDVAGIFVNGKLQSNTPYVDLRSLPEEKWKKYVAGIFQAIQQNKDKQMAAGSNAYDILKNHFGDAVTDEIFVPILEKLYLTHPRHLAEMATQFTTINRVALFDEAVMLDLMKAPDIRARICYPDQFTLPPYRENNQRGFYPKEYGMFRVLDKLKKLLESQGARFLTSTVISDVKIENKKAKSVTVKNKDGQEETFSVDEIFWTAGLPTLAKTLHVNTSDLVNDKKHTAGMFVNLLFDKMPAMDKLYYFYCFDKGYQTFRVTNYSNYCPAAGAGRGFPLCVEFWAQEGTDNSPEEILARVKKELCEFGVIDDSYTILFSRVEKHMSGGFPLPSVNNIRNMNTISERIKNACIENIIATGVLAEKNVFFIKDVLIDAYKKVKTRSWSMSKDSSKAFFPFIVNKAI